MASATSPASRAPRLDGLPRAAPPARLLSNGTYRVLITPSGTGSSMVGNVALTRWCADPVEDAHGLRFHVRDRDRGDGWMLACGRDPETSTAEWRPGVFRIVRRHDGVRAEMEVCVVEDRRAELRRVRLVNEGDAPRRLDVTGFAEIVLADPASFRAHPAFSKLFLQTEHVRDAGAVLARRRPRARGDSHPWLVHSVAGPGAVEVETDRVRFLGRGLPAGAARALAPGESLSGTTGPVLDAVAALRVRADLEPGGSAEWTFLLGSAEDRDGALGLAKAFRSPGGVAAAFAAAERAERARIDAAGLSEAEAAYFQALAGAMAYGHAGIRGSGPLRAAPDRAGALRRHGIDDADLLAVVRTDVPAGALVHDMIRAHRYWKALGLPVKAVVLAAGDAERTPRTRDGLLVLPERELAAGDADALVSSARLVVSDELPDLDAVADAATRAPSEARAPQAPATTARAGNGAGDGEDLLHFNGYGGFSADGREYVIRIPRAPDGSLALPPNPWVNVIANERFGCLVSETGAGTTWSGNSRERRITDWMNDAVLDPHSEAFHVHDEIGGELWSPLPGPTPGPGDYETRHGFGASVFRTAAHGIRCESTVFVPLDDRVRIVTIRLRNEGDRPRRLAVSGYARPVLGSDPDRDCRFLTTELDPASGAVLVRSAAGGAFGDGVVFAAALGGAPGSSDFTTDRLAFLGAGGSPALPAALSPGRALDGRTGSGFDVCIAQRVRVELAAGEARTVTFLLGEADPGDDVAERIARYRSPDRVSTALEEVRAFWARTCSAVRIRTPSSELDLLVNGWLPYQVLSCRMWGRSAFYQSGGAFGFRDQLQDSGALLWAWPGRTRDQILLHAAHQFVEGDVLHWWHPPDSRGIRTRFVDDLLWLPYLTAHYIDVTGDEAVLDEVVPFLSAPPLAPGAAEEFVHPVASGESASLHDHCCRAVDRSLETGAHGLPLFGAGDWNDGMNRVGAEGRGESVWMAMFLHVVLGDMAERCEARGDGERAVRYRAHREKLRQAANEAGWDGEWYRRGYYDNGEPLGSSASDECRIDALVQAWAVLSGIAPPDRAARALDAMDARLVSEQDGILRLLTPAFDRTPNDPGYIRGYVPGVRENGGQYTHAALWAVRAMAEGGRRDRVAALLHLLNPVRHAADRARADVYRVEPYVVAADVYGEPPHVGRGGWTWYTGAAGWMHRVALESLLGLRVRGGARMEIRPCVPDEWPGYEVSCRAPDGVTGYEIRVTNPRGASARVVAATLDGAPVPVTGGAAVVPLARDGKSHRVDVELGPEAAS